MNSSFFRVNSISRSKESISANKNSRPILEQTVRDLVARNESEISLPPIQPDPRFRVAGRHPLDVYRKEGSWSSEYPGAIGIVLVSLPGYALDGRSAVVYWSRFPTGRRGELLYGVSLLTCLKRAADGRWVVDWERVVHAA